MDIEEYFNQDEFYFSESAGQLIRIDEMPFQQAFFSHRKLLREWVDVYVGSNLYQKFIRKICPTSQQIREQLQLYGKACHAIYEPGVLLQKTNGTAVRTKMYRAARRPGTRVRTHKVNTSVGDYIEATIPVSLSVKGQAV